MDKFLHFTTLMSLWFGIAAVAWIILNLVGWFNYNHTTWGKIEQVRDSLRGQRYTYPIVKPVIIAIVCWTWYFVCRG